MGDKKVYKIYFKMHFELISNIKSQVRPDNTYNN